MTAPARDHLERLEAENAALRARIDDMTAGGDAFRGLTPTEGALLAFLLRRQGFITYGAVHAALYGMRRDGGADPECIKVYVCKIRRKLARAGAKGPTIETLWGQGYRLTAEGRAAAARLSAAADDTGGEG